MFDITTTMRWLYFWRLLESTLSRAIPIASSIEITELLGDELKIKNRKKLRNIFPPQVFLIIIIINDIKYFKKFHIIK